MKKTHKYISIGIISLIVIVSVVLLFQPSQVSSEPIKAVYLPAVQSLPLFVAVEQGMFKEAGLNVELQRIESPNQIIDALVSGNSDVGAPSVASGITAIVDLKNSGVIKIYSLTCGDLDHLNDELLVAKDSSISSISDLRGKRLGHIPGIQFATIAKKILLENNVSLSEVTLVEIPIPNQIPALASGSVDAVLALEPTATIGSQKNVSKLLVRNPMVKYIADPWCGGAGVVSAKFLEERPKEAKLFIEIMRKALIKTQEDPENRKYLVQYLQLPESVAKEVPLPIFMSTENIDSKIVQAYQKFADIFYELNVTQARPDVTKLILG